MSTHSNSHDDFDAHAGIHFRNLEAPTTRPNAYGNNMLRAELAKRGVGVLLVPNAEAYTLKDQTVTVHPVTGDDDMVIQRAIEVSMRDGLDVVRSRVATPRGLEEQLPVLNGLRLRKIGGSKWQQYELAHEFMPKTVAVEADQPVNTEDIAALKGDTLVVKADLSQDMQYLQIAARGEVSAAINGMRAQFAEQEAAMGKSRANKRILVQEFAEGTSWPSLIPVDEKSKGLMDAAQNTELRVYCYVDTDKEIPAEQRHYATGRSFHDGTDDWFSVDQASVPAQAWSIADTVSDRLLQAARVPGGYFAIDLFRSSTGGYFIREINTRDPMMLSSSDNPYDARKQRELLAGIMAVLARKK